MLCKICNKGHDGSFGSGKYCCRACANSRVKTDEIKQKISRSILNGIQEGRISTGNSKGVKHKTPRTDQHIEKIAASNRQRWAEKGKKTIEQKRAGNKASVYAYRARKRDAIPENADLALIKKIYECTPEGYQVDHIIPISRNGLHHQDNLQYLPIRENQIKNNRLDYTGNDAIRWQDLL